MKKTIWFDITNTPHVHFLSAIYDELKNERSLDFTFTARDFSETVKLLKNRINSPFKVIGKHHGKSKLRKSWGLLNRFKDIAFSNAEYDVSISCGSENAIWTSYFKRKQSIAFGDNDLARQWTYGPFVGHAFFPDAIQQNVLTRQGISKQRLTLYPGFKEDIYLADFKPNPDFLDSLPFNEYIIVRPENLMANYIGKRKVQSITPDLLRLLSLKGFNILYLPRYDSDKNFSEGVKNIYTPSGPISGLDACYYATAVLTGAGTFAREAACLGVPSFSFYAGTDLMAVDKKLINEEKMFFSREPNEIISKLMKSDKKAPDLSRSIKVKNEVMGNLKELLD